MGYDCQVPEAKHNSVKKLPQPPDADKLFFFFMTQNIICWCLKVLCQTYVMANNYWQEN